jgi:hypothetical protein
MNNIIDFQAYKNKKYIERRKGIQQLTGMVGEPLDLEKILKPEDCQEQAFTENEIGY